MDAPPPPKYVLFYEPSPEAMELAAVHYPAHAELVQQFHARGELLAVGTFTNAFEDGSMAVFTTRDAADRFVDADPFRTEGVVAAWRILEWHETLLRT